MAFISGLPAGLKVDRAFIDREPMAPPQARTRWPYEEDRNRSGPSMSGVRHGATIGSPVAILLENKDWKNWTESLPVEPGDPAKHKRVASPRPGHADLAGALKYNFSEARYVLERASARESAARVAIGAVAKQFLADLGIEVLSHVVAVGATELKEEVAWEKVRAVQKKMKSY